MTMGERIRQARLEAGLSQRQLAGEEITRNMLSALEHDGANPSVGTLKYLSEKLCKPISYFLGEELPGVPEAQEMARARAAFGAGAYRECLRELEGLQWADFAAERRLLEALAAMELARQAIGQRRFPYANQLLERSWAAGEECPYFGPELERKWRILAAQAALDDGNAARAGRLLDAVDDRECSAWNWLRGEAYFADREYKLAAECYHRAEKDRPGECGKRLEICYREMEDYKMAYYYATRE